MKTLLKILLLSCFISTSLATEDQPIQDPDSQFLNDYFESSKEMDLEINEKTNSPYNKYLEAINSYKSGKKTEAETKVKDSYKLAHDFLKELWGNTKTNRVPDVFVKKLTDFGMSQESFETMVLSISGINSVHSCQNIKVKAPDGGILEKAAKGMKREYYKHELGIKVNSNGYFTPSSQHYFKAASAIYLLNLAYTQKQLIDKTNLIKEAHGGLEKPSQGESLRSSLELSKVAADYAQKQVELKELYKTMLASAAIVAKNEMTNKANRVAYTSKKKEDAKDKYKKKKKRAATSAAKREALKYYHKYKEKKYYYDQARVHTHIKCATLVSSEQAQHSFDFYDKAMDLLISKAMADEQAPKGPPVYDYYLEYSKEQNSTTNNMMGSPEKRYEFLSKFAAELVNNDLNDTIPNAEITQGNFQKLAKVYEKMSGISSGEVQEGGEGSLKKISKDNSNIKSATLGDCTNCGATIAGGAALAASTGANTGSNISSGSLEGPSLLGKAAAALTKSNKDIKPIKFAPLVDSSKNPNSYLNPASSLSTDEIRNKINNGMSVTQRSRLASYFDNSLKNRIGNNEVPKDATISEAAEKKVNKDEGSNIDLPDIDEEKSITLMKLKKALKKQDTATNEDSKIEDSLVAEAEVENKSKDDINHKRNTSIWIIISNRYVRSGFKRLLKKK